MKTSARCLLFVCFAAQYVAAQSNESVGSRHVRLGLDLSKPVVNLSMFNRIIVAEPSLYVTLKNGWDLVASGSYVWLKHDNRLKENFYGEGFGLKIGPEYHFDQTWFAGVRLMGSRFVEHKFVRLEGPYFGDYLRDLVPLRRRFIGGLEFNGGAYFPIGNWPLYGRVEARVSLLYSDAEPAMTYAPAVGWVGAKGLVPSGGISFSVVFPR